MTIQTPDAAPPPGIPSVPETLMLGFRERLKGAGIRFTRQRAEIYAALLESRMHPDAEALHRTLSGRLPPISLDTVYRTLWTFQDLNIVNTVGPRRGSARFDGNPERHHHFICTACGSIGDFTDPSLEALPLPPSALALGQVESVHFEFHGTCAACAAKASAAGAATISLSHGDESPAEGERKAP